MSKNRLISQIQSSAMLWIDFATIYSLEVLVRADTSRRFALRVIHVQYFTPLHRNDITISRSPVRIPRKPRMNPLYFIWHTFDASPSCTLHPRRAWHFRFYITFRPFPFFFTFLNVNFSFPSTLESIFCKLSWWRHPTNTRQTYCNWLAPSSYPASINYFIYECWQKTRYTIAFNLHKSE